MNELEKLRQENKKLKQQIRERKKACKQIAKISESILANCKHITKEGDDFNFRATTRSSADLNNSPK